MLSIRSFAAFIHYQPGSGTGEFNTAGGAATFSQTISMSAAGGAFSSAGDSATLQYGQQVQAANGAFSVAGFDALAGHGFIANVGIYTVQGGLVQNYVFRRPRNTPPSNTSLPRSIQIVIGGGGGGGGLVSGGIGGTGAGTQLGGSSALVVGHDEETDLEISYVWPGGFDKATFKLCDQDPPEFTSHVTIRDLHNVKTIYAGRVSNVKLSKDGWEVTCESQKVWTTDRRVTLPVHGFGDELSFRYPSGTRVTEIIRDMLSRLCPDIYDSGHIVDSSLQLSEPSPDMSGWTFADVMSWAVGLTSFLGTPLTWGIFNCGLSDYGCLYVFFEDTSARLRVQYNDSFTTEFDDQLFRNTYTVEWGKDQLFTVPENGQGIQYDALASGVIRDGYANTNNEVRVLNDAKALAYGYFNRTSQWRSTRDSITIDCSKDEQVICTPGGLLTPEVTSVQHIDPWMVPIGYGCAIENIPKKWGRYGTPNVKFLTSRKYSFKSGLLEMQFGMPAGLAEQVRLINNFEVNRPTVVVEAIGGAAPLVNQDTTPAYGPSFSITTVKDPSLTTGIPVIATKGTIDQGPMINGGVIHPNIIADEGLEANFIVGDLTTDGFKGAIRVIPGVFNEIEVLLMNDSGLVQDSCFIRLYTLPKGNSSAIQQIAELPLTQKRNLFRLDSTHDIELGTRSWILPQVVTPSTIALTASISLHAKRDYPDLVLK